MTSVKIRAIWFADSANQGASGVVNEHILGDDRGMIPDLVSYGNVCSHGFSELVRSFPRSFTYGESFPRPDQATDRGDSA